MNIKKIKKSIKQRDNLADNLKWYINNEAFLPEKKSLLEALKVVSRSKEKLEKGIKKENDKLNILKTLDNVTIYDSYNGLLDQKLSNSDDKKSDYKALMIELEHIDFNDYIIEVQPGNGVSYYFNDILEAYDLA